MRAMWSDAQPPPGALRLDCPTALDREDTAHVEELLPPTEEGRRSAAAPLRELETAGISRDVINH